MKEEKEKKSFFLEVCCFISRLYFRRLFVSLLYLIQSIVGFISSLCYFVGNGRVQLFLLNFFAVFRNSMNVIANVKKLFKFFVIDGKGRVGIRAIL